MSCSPCRQCGHIHDCDDPCYTGTCTTGCPIQLDFSCVIYHKNNNEITALDGLDLPNGSTLELIIESLDEKIKQIDVLSTNLTYLRTKYLINTLQQFLISVSTELDILNVWRGNVTADPGSPTDGWYWFRSDTGELKVQLNGSTRLISIV